MPSRPERMYKVLDTHIAHNLTCESTRANRPIVLRDGDKPQSLAELNALTRKYEGKVSINTLEVLSEELDCLADLYLEMGDGPDSLVDLRSIHLSDDNLESLSSVHIGTDMLVRNGPVLELKRDPNRIEGKLRHCDGRYRVGRDLEGKEYYRDE